MGNKILKSFVAFAFILSLCAPFDAHAVSVDLFVSTTGDDENGTNDCTVSAYPCATIRRAVDLINANSSISEGIIHLDPGTYAEEFVEIKRNTTIDGAGIDVSFIGGGLTSSNSQGLLPLVKIRNLTFQGSYFRAEEDTTLDLSSVRVTEDTQIHNDGGTVDIHDTAFDDETRIINKSNSFMFIERTTFIGVTPPFDAPAIYNKADAQMTITESSIWSTTGKAIENDGNLLIDATSIRDGRSTDESIIWNRYGGSLSIIASSFLYNEVLHDPQTTDKSGAPILNDGFLRIEESEVSENRALFGVGNFGGALTTFGSATIIASTFARNYGNNGGAINHFSGKLYVQDSTITSNVAEGDGGGIHSRGEALVIDNSAITNNQASLLFSYGGGVSLYRGKLFINQSTIANNSASYEGGGIYVASEDARAELRNVTVAYNRINDPYGKGAGITVARNAIVETGNSIIALNESGGNDCGYGFNGGTFISVGYNLDSDGSCSLTGAGDVTSANPELDVLADNGGPTKTIALLGGPAVDAADPNGCFRQDEFGLSSLLQFDQRATPFKRHYDAGSGSDRCDMGAYEANEPVYEGG